MQATATLKRQLASKGQPCEHIRSDAWGVITHILQEDGLAGFWKGEGGKVGGGEEAVWGVRLLSCRRVLCLGRCLPHALRALLCLLCSPSLLLLLVLLLLLLLSCVLPRSGAQPDPGGEPSCAVHGL
jgi:hypothetical protein